MPIEDRDTNDNSALENKDFTTVTFKNLVAHFYFINNLVAVKAKADSISMKEHSVAENNTATQDSIRKVD